MKIIMFPAANPSGLARNKRRNYLNRDLNRHFCEKHLQGENKILHNAIKKENIIFFHAIHEDSSSPGFYIYNFEKKKEIVYRRLIMIAKKIVPIQLSRSIHGDKANEGLITNRKDGSFEDRMARDGIRHSMCTKCPGKISIEKRIKLNVMLMNEVTRFSSRQ